MTTDTPELREQIDAMLSNRVATAEETRRTVDAIEQLVNERVAEAFRDGHQKGQKYPNLAPGFFERD